MPKLSPPTGDRGKMVLTQKTYVFEDQVAGIKSLVGGGRFQNEAQVVRAALDNLLYGQIPDRSEPGIPLELIEKAMDAFKKRMGIKAHSPSKSPTQP